jgi:hypothetical protein
VPADYSEYQQGVSACENAITATYHTQYPRDEHVLSPTNQYPSFQIIDKDHIYTITHTNISSDECCQCFSSPLHEEHEISNHDVNTDNEDRPHLQQPQTNILL